MKHSRICSWCAQTFPLKDVLALARAQKGLEISRPANARLRKAKLIEGRGRGTRIRSAIVAATGQKADYIRTRVQDDAH